MDFTRESLEGDSAQHYFYMLKLEWISLCEIVFSTVMRNDFTNGVGGTWMGSSDQTPPTNPRTYPTLPENPLFTVPLARPPQ